MSITQNRQTINVAAPLLDATMGFSELSDIQVQLDRQQPIQLDYAEQGTAFS